MPYKIWVETAITQYLVTVYGKLDFADISITLQYSYNDVDWNNLDTFISTTCTIRGSFYVTSGNSASVRAVDGSGNTYFLARANNSTTCPGSPYNACSALVSNVTSNRNVAITVDTSAQC